MALKCSPSTAELQKFPYSMDKKKNCFLMQHLIDMFFASIGPYQNLFELSLIVSVLKSQILTILQSTKLLEILSCFVTHWKLFD